LIIIGPVESPRHRIMQRLSKGGPPEAAKHLLRKSRVTRALSAIKDIFE
jgi:hypothetical protein